MRGAPSVATSARPAMEALAAKGTWPLVVPAQLQRRRRFGNSLLLPLPDAPVPDGAARLQAGRAASSTGLGLVWYSQCTHPIQLPCK